MQPRPSSETTRPCLPSVRCSIVATPCAFTDIQPAATTPAGVMGGLALLPGLPPNVRGIPVRLSIAYFKKARGLLTAEARCPLPDTSVDAEHDFETVVSDASGDVVARATVRWRLGPAPAP